MVLLLETTVCEACLYSKGLLITCNLYSNLISSLGFVSWSLFLQQSVQCRQILFNLLYREFLDVACFVFDDVTDTFLKSGWMVKQ